MQVLLRRKQVLLKIIFRTSMQRLVSHQDSASRTYTRVLSWNTQIAIPGRKGMSVQWTRVPGAAVVVGPVVAEAVLDSRVVVEMATVDVVAAAGTVVETSQRVRMNNVDVADPNRNFQADEWEKLGSGGRAYVLRLRDTPAGGRGGRDGGRGGGAGRSVDGQRSASAASTATNANNTETGTQRGSSDQSVVSEIMERGSQNGRNFGRGAY
jgi:hypothetical protein